MEKIGSELEKIILDLLLETKNNKEVPSKEILDTIDIFIKLNNCY